MRFKVGFNLTAKSSLFIFSKKAAIKILFGGKKLI